MNKKGPKYDSEGNELTMKPYHFAGDALGQLALNMCSSLGGFMTYFYTEKIGLSAAVVGMIMLIKSIIDAFTDIGMGVAIDKVHSKRGKARPWLLWMAIPMSIGTIAQFAIPDGLPEIAKYIWVFITMTITAGVIFTAVSIPYNALITYVTKSSAEKRTMGILRAGLGVLFSIFIGIVIMPLTNAMGGDKSAWIKLVSICSIISSICMLITYAVTKERNAELNSETIEESKYSTKTKLKFLFQNKYWVIMLIVGILMSIFYTVINGSGIAYYAQYVLGDSNLSGAIAAYLLIPLIAGFVLTGPLFQKFGMVKVIQWFQVVGIIGCAIRIFLPTNFPVVVVTACMMTFASTAINGALTVLINYTAVYNKLKYDEGMVGIVNGANSFGSKVGSGLGSAAIGWILALFGYDASLASQPTSVITGAEVVYNIVPLLTMLFIIVLLHWYDLDKQYPEMVKEIEMREKNAESM